MQKEFSEYGVEDEICVDDVLNGEKKPARRCSLGVVVCVIGLQLIGNGIQECLFCGTKRKRR